MIGSFTLSRMNRLASLAILPLMTLAIVVFAQFTDAGSSEAPPPASGTVVVANLRDETLSFVDLATGTTRELSVPGPPHEIVETGGRLYVTLGRADALVEVEPGSASILRVIPLAGEPHGLAAWGDNLIVTLDKANAAIVLDRASLTEIRRYPTGNTPHVVAVSSDAVLVTDSRDNAIRQLLPGDAVIPSGLQPEGIAIAGHLVVTADAAGGTLTIAGASNLTSPATVAVGSGPVRVIALDSSRVLVSLQGEDRLAVVDLKAREVVRRITTGERPDGLCPSPDGKYAGSAANGDGALHIFATQDWGSVLRLNLSAGLGSCLWLPVR